MDNVLTNWINLVSQGGSVAWLEHEAEYHHHVQLSFLQLLRRAHWEGPKVQRMATLHKTTGGACNLQNEASTNEGHLMGMGPGYVCGVENSWWIPPIPNATIGKFLFYLWTPKTTWTGR